MTQRSGFIGFPGLILLTQGHNRLRNYLSFQTVRGKAVAVSDFEHPLSEPKTLNKREGLKHNEYFP